MSAVSLLGGPAVIFLFLFYIIRHSFMLLYRVEVAMLILANIQSHGKEMCYTHFGFNILRGMFVKQAHK